MIIRGENTYKTLIMNVLDKGKKLNKRRQLFVCEVFMLFLSIKGKINFLQLGRYGSLEEQAFRIQFEKRFDFLGFNSDMVKAQGSGHNVIAFDPSYISKSGKKTPGIGWYWSGCAGKAKWGLEISGIAAIDVANHTAFHLEAVQTNFQPDSKENLVSWYLKVIGQRKTTLKGISTYMVFDAWFTKVDFVNGIVGHGFEMIGRLRDDADLRYLSKASPTGKKGRPKRFAGKVNPKSINLEYFTPMQGSEDAVLHSAVVNSKSLKRDVLVVHARYKSESGKEVYKMYFSTDTKLDPVLVIEYYKNRFQIEFLYRDGKQFCGLNDSQARSSNKLDFHFNASLTAVNIAKVEHWLKLPPEKRNQFSMSDIKTMNHNRLLINAFCAKFGINPDLPKYQKDVNELLLYGTIAA